jgi:digeranylgeranylglycerophospholipid reductase
MDADVVIVGAGPVGARMATVLAERGCSTLVLEEHLSLGRPFQCAGLINPAAMDAVGLQSTILASIDGATIHGPIQAKVDVGVPGQPRTFAVCRNRFDEGVMHQALAAGARLRLGCAARGAVPDEDGWSITTELEHGTHETLRTRLLIGADGAHSRVRHWMRAGRPSEMMIGAQVEITGFDGRENWLEMFTGQDVAPGFFAWAIPTGFGTHRVGLWGHIDHSTSKASVEHRLSHLLRTSRHADRFCSHTVVARYCGPIPAGMVKRIHGARSLLIGDAAGLAKPTTGGGIGPGFEQVATIADALADAIHSDQLDLRSLGKVVKPLERLRKDQRRARALRNLFLTESDDATLESHIRTFSEHRVLEMIHRLGDIEHPIPLGVEMLRKVPAFRPLAVRAGWAVLTA